MQRTGKLMFTTSLLFLSLVACNNMTNNALDSRIIDEDFLELQQATFNDFPDEDEQGQLSSESTTVPSGKFPHTRAIQVQPARYEFVIVDDQQHAPQQGTAQLTRNEIEQLLPEELRQRIQEGTFERQPETTQQPDTATEQPQAPAQPGARPEQNQTPAPGAPTPEAPAQDRFDQPEYQEPTNQPRPGNPEEISDVEARVIELTNVERRNNGMSDLQVDSPLSHVAREKSSDMRKNNYFSHTSPIYGSPFDMIRDFGVSYSAAGENIAMGQRSAEEVVQAWMDSEGHRANILNGTFTHIGVGYIENGNYWTQMFISR
jgi:uncharacterized YkwD family protein